MHWQIHGALPPASPSLQLLNSAGGSATRLEVWLRAPVHFGLVVSERAQCRRYSTFRTKAMGPDLGWICCCWISSQCRNHLGFRYFNWFPGNCESWVTLRMSHDLRLWEGFGPAVASAQPTPESCFYYICWNISGNTLVKILLTKSATGWLQNQSAK